LKGCINDAQNISKFICGKPFLPTQRERRDPAHAYTSSSRQIDSGISKTILSCSSMTHATLVKSPLEPT
jgi:hypothetical protein